LMFGITLANLVKAPVALLLGVPNQPLLGNRKEDHLIAETFVRYLETDDNRWPLLFPMVKSVVQSMDAIEEFTGAQWEKKITGFVVSGASKRGWTAWLTAASDPRVIAVAPMVIDLLNIPEQLPLQVSRFGATSEMISPYTDRGLVPFHDTEEARALWRMVDPWTYRSLYTMPKLILLGTNDPYWTTDALNVYWDGLPAGKYVSYSPNAGHALMERGANGRTGLPWRAINNLAAFVRSQVSGKPFPAVSWVHEDGGDGSFLLKVDAKPLPEEVLLWTARSPIQDFRGARWESESVQVSPRGEIRINVPVPANGYIAFFAEVGYDFEGLPLKLSTQIRLDGTSAKGASEDFAE
jgi:PhoPQ-activated pathogenicity-related protein